MHFGFAEAQTILAKCLTAKLALIGASNANCMFKLSKSACMTRHGLQNSPIGNIFKAPAITFYIR
jgi:hypothetical protein